MKDPTIEITYQEPVMGQPAPVTPVEELTGLIPNVASVPTWTPKRFKDNFAFYKSGATIRFYIYDSVNNAWRYTALT